MKKTWIHRLIFFHVVFLAFLSLVACDNETEDVDEQVDSGPDESTEDTETEIDPEEVAKNREASHDTLVDPECWKAGCHSRDTTHNPDMLPHQCAKCHGDKGPEKPLGHQVHHAGGGCDICHGEVHEPKEDFPAPKSCNVCHKPSRTE